MRDDRATREACLAERALRSLLFCPGDSARKMEKALAAGADAVILDLEDAVAPAAKAEARGLVRDTLGRLRTGAIIVRVNAADTDLHLEDLAAVVPAGPDAIMLPKCAGAADLRQLADRLDALEAAFGLERRTIGILPLVTETAAALARLDYAGVTQRLVALGFAGEDLASDLGVAARAGGTMNPLLAEARRAVAFAAATAGVPAIDTPFPDPRDPDQLSAEARAAVALGYGGKFCIHPGQIAVVNAAFRPDDAQVRWGQTVIAALGDAGVALVDGRMVDRAHLPLARRYVRLAETGR